MCSIIKLATIAFDETSSYWSAPKSSQYLGFHWSPHGCLLTIGQHFVTTRVVHLPKRTETSLITESDQSRANHQLLQLCTVHTAWSESDQALRAVHSCKSWLVLFCCFTSTVNSYRHFGTVSLPDHTIPRHIQKKEHRPYFGVSATQA